MTIIEMRDHGTLLFSDAAARNVDGGRPRRDSAHDEQRDHGSGRHWGITFKPRSQAGRFGMLERPARCRPPCVRDPTTPGRLVTTNRCGSLRQRPTNGAKPGVPGDDAHRDARGACSRFGDRSGGAERRSSRHIRPGLDPSFPGPAAGSPSIHSPDRRSRVEPHRRPVALSRQAKLADDPGVAKESEGFLE